jgi:SagB-type dehydrogenase family enzyme
MADDAVKYAVRRALRPLATGTKVLEAIVPAPSELGHLLKVRRSERSFSDQPIPQEKLERILVDCCGAVSRMTSGKNEEMELLFRTIPQGGAISSIRLSLVLTRATTKLGKGIYTFCHCTNTLHRPNVPDLNIGRFEDALGCHEPANLAAALIISGDMETKTYKYGDLGNKLVMIEAGCALQNASLSACDQKVSAFAWGRFRDKEMAEMLGLSYPEEIPLVGLMLGMPLN